SFSGSTPPSLTSAPRISDADVDGFILGAFLFHSATERSRKVLRITGEADAHEYARSLNPGERLAALRALAREALQATRPAGRSRASKRTSRPTIRGARWTRATTAAARCWRTSAPISRGGGPA